MTRSARTVRGAPRPPRAAGWLLLAVVAAVPAPAGAQEIGAATADVTSSFDFVTLRNGGVVRGEVVTLAAGVLLMDDAVEGISRQIPEAELAAFEPAGSTRPAALREPEDPERGGDLVFLRDGRIRGGRVTRIDRRQVVSEAGVFERSEVWRVLFRPEPESSEPLWRQRAEPDPETEATLDLLVNPDQWLEHLEDPDLPEDLRREIEELLREQERSRDAFEQMPEPSTLLLGVPNGWCWTGHLETSTESRGPWGAVTWNGRLELTLDELEMPIPGPALGLRSATLAARRGSYVAEQRQTGECSGRFHSAGPVTPEMFLGGLPMLGTIGTITPEYAEALEEETGQKIPAYENYYALETTTIQVSYEYRLACRDGHTQKETGLHPVSYAAGALNASEGIPLLEENGTRMRGSATPDFPGEDVKVSWDLRRVVCPLPAAPLDFEGPDDDPCDQDWSAIAAGYEPTLARLRGELARIWDEVTLDGAEAERLRPAFDRLTVACGAFDIATTILTGFLGRAEELADLLAARDVIEGIITGDLGFLLPDAPWKLFQHALSVRGAFTADLAAMRNRVESCRGKVPSADYFAAVGFVDSLASFADAAARAARKVMEFQEYDLQRWEELTAARERCLECAAQGHLDPADCPQVPPLR